MLRPWFNRFTPIPQRPAVIDWPYVASLAAHMALGFTVSLALAWLSYHLYEKHFLRLKRFFAPDPRPPCPAPPA
jgi:peptidoglycan/LPS O-acetylase OafA/YrhL